MIVDKNSISGKILSKMDILKIFNLKCFLCGKGPLSDGFAL